MKDTVDLRNFKIASNEWVRAIASHAAEGSTSASKFVLAGTSITDIGISHLYRIKALTSLDISSCHLLTDDCLNTIGCHLRFLHDLLLNDCRRFSSAGLCKVWKNCKRLQTISARRCPGVTDSVLTCLANTKRTSSYPLRFLDIRQCKNVTSAGISHLANSVVDSIAMFHLAVDDCLGLRNMAFLEFETSSSLCLLKSLSLKGLDIDETAINWIVKGCKSLQRLDVGRCKLISDFALTLMAPLISSPIFAELNLSECPLLTDMGIQNLFLLEEKKGFSDDDDIPQMSIAMLNLKQCFIIGDEAMVYVGKYCGNLVKLNIKGLKKVSDRGISDIAKGCPLLRKLSMSGRSVTSRSFKLLGKLCRNLEVLCASKPLDFESPTCFMNFKLSEAMSSNSLQLLKRIDLSATNVCDIGVSVLAKACHQLESIDLSKCAQITDVATEALARCCFRLQTLLLANSRGITDRTLIALALTNIPLEFLDLTGNTRVTDEGLLVLCTNCQQIQKLCIKGCDRLSQHVINHCNANLLPFTQPFIVGLSTLTLEPLPKAHIALLQLLHTQYTAAIVLQANFRRWNNRNFTIRFLARRRLLRETRAARKVQKCARNFLAWRRFLYLLTLRESIDKIVCVQAHVRGNCVRRDVRIWRFIANIAIRRIQQFYRVHFVANMTKFNFNAREIQRVYRGYLARQRHQELIQERKIKFARKIEQWYLRCCNHSEFRERSRWLVRKIRNVQDQWRIYKQRKHFTKYLNKHREAARKIQSVWRRKLAMRYVSTLRIKFNSASLTIQRIYRGYITRKRVTLYRTMATAAAIALQSQWRRHCAQTLYMHQRRIIIHTQQSIHYARIVRRFKHIIRQAVHKYHNDASVEIQRIYRGMLGRKRAVVFRKIRYVDLVTKTRNARQKFIQQQFIVTGATLRIQYWLQSIFNRQKRLKIITCRHNRAVKCIQQYFKKSVKCIKQSRTLEAKSHASEDIQRVFRGLVGRKQFQTLHHQQQQIQAAQKLQRVYRGYLGRKRYYEIYNARLRAALSLQRTYRTRHAAKLYAISTAVAALKTKEQYDRSFFGRLEAHRNPMIDLYRRAKLQSDKVLLTQLKDKWVSHRLDKERAVRKLKRECAAVWKMENEVMESHFAARHQLYGVTETVYATSRELEQQQKVQMCLQIELAELRNSIIQFKRAMRNAVEKNRMLESSEVFDLLKEHNLVLERPNNQHNN
ncbi:F-box protein containing LRR [Plasmopara halstedii]|uniref:F-box protein containing LRR n=1 Tax=Plasmopara halstedii TaxID=4781 RepID=A0A0P1AHX6_PLAHL|nr:F-box protein containing LRR [Plasmopara halstedii]CEG40778.1 F-box protein containing LRR [Plasmopara halstedii]|eukprot:XP_024577147.1 F-box protein containing LRR [Plasmopara halstedii]